MNKLEFIEYSAKRYGIDFSVAETLVNMFGDCLSELLDAGESVDIDGIGKFEKHPLFPDGLNHQNKIALAGISRKSMVSFSASDNLCKAVS